MRSPGTQAIRFPLVPRYEGHGIRRRVHGNYLIFYRVAEQEERTIIFTSCTAQWTAILLREVEVSMFGLTG